MVALFQTPSPVHIFKFCAGHICLEGCECLVTPLGNSENVRHRLLILQVSDQIVKKKMRDIFVIFPLQSGQVRSGIPTILRRTAAIPEYVVNKLI